MKYLFWNTHKNIQINDVLSEIIIENDINMVLLAEYNADSADLITKVSNQHLKMQEYPMLSKRIKMFGTIANIHGGKESDQYCIRVINNQDIICCVHLNSKIYNGEADSREDTVQYILHDIEEKEQEINSENSIVVGDFNSNPYDNALINARYFHGMPIYDIAKSKSRTFNGHEYRMFYNPMWNFLGDADKPYGTYYYSGSNAINTYWHIYDQVIIRPALKERFIQDSLKIITGTKTKSLLNGKGHPDKQYSDHLPIMFEIK